MKDLDTQIFTLERKQGDGFTSTEERVSKIEGSLLKFERNITAVEALDEIKADFKLVYDVEKKLEELDRATPSLPAHQVLTRKVEHHLEHFEIFKTSIQR